MSARWIKGLCVCVVLVGLLVGCGLKKASPKNATAGNVSATNVKQPQAAKADGAPTLGSISYKGFKMVSINKDNVIAVITEENFSQIIDTMEEDKSETIANYLDRAIDLLNNKYIAKTEHAKDTWIAYQRLDDANDGSVRIDLGLAEDQNQAKMVTTSTVSGKFDILATVKLTKDGDLILTDKGQYKDSKIGSIGPAPN